MYTAPLISLSVGAIYKIASITTPSPLPRMETEAEAWDKLPIRAIIKSADKDLKTYFMRQQEYFLIVRDIRDLRPHDTPTDVHRVALLNALDRLRSSPLFNDDYKLVYNALRISLIKSGSHGLTCKKFKELFPNNEKMYGCSEFKNLDEVIPINELFNALDIKLIY